MPPIAQPMPLKLRPILMPKVWGGDRLARFGKAVSAGEQIGESWEVADMAATSASGAGGSAARSTIAEGALAGQGLAEAAAQWGEKMLGTGRGGSASRAFPLLVKFLDARENLSVQVHPSAAYAAEHHDCHLKTECWYVLDAAPGAKIYKGVRAGVARQIFDQAARRNDGGLVELLEAVPAVVGECHVLPSGTVHALGAGVLVAEVQTPSDTTFRLYDWGRQGRQLHIEEALACADLSPAPAATRYSRGPWSPLVANEYFFLHECRAGEGATVDLGQAGRCCVLMVLAGRGKIACGRHSFEPVGVRAGETVVLPACLGDCALLHADPALTALRATVA